MSGPGKKTPPQRKRSGQPRQGAETRESTRTPRPESRAGAAARAIPRPPGLPTAGSAAQRVTVAVASGVARLKILRPSFDHALHTELVAACANLDLDEAVRVVLLELPPRCVAPISSTDSSPVPDGVAAVAALRVPVLGLMRGLIADEWLELALACDLRLAAPATRFVISAVTGGDFPRHGATQRLPRLIGQATALWMLLTGEPLTASRAQALGLVDRIVPTGEMLRVGREQARRLALRAPIAQRFAKEAMRAAGDLPLAEGLRLEGDLYALLQTTTDRLEGLTAFRERRRPRFSGR